MFCMEILLLHFVTEINECIDNNGGYKYSCHNTIGSLVFSLLVV